MALVNINFTVLAHAYVLYARALQSRIQGGTFAAPVRPALKSGTAMRTTVKSGTASRTFYAAPAYRWDDAGMAAHEMKPSLGIA